MDFESPDVMKDFPGLYASELSKKCNNDSDFSDENEKAAKKDGLIIKRKDKKDKKDKERGYAALEGESSLEEDEAKSPSKSKKSKSFKFTSSKSKEKREKSREKEKDVIDKKKDKEKKIEKRMEKERLKADKKERKVKHEEGPDIAEGLPIFGVSLDTAVERSRCHDGLDIPLPLRECIDYIQQFGLNYEGIYKNSGTKSKVLHIKKCYNQRRSVDLSEYDVPTITSVLKTFLRDLPEPIFTSDSLIRFEEAGAILNIGSREKHLKILVENLPKNNKTLLSWLLIHLDTVILNERQNKMNIQSIVAAFHSTLHTSQRLLTALIHHCRSLFPNVSLIPYIPPLTSSAKLPDDPDLIEVELRKQESLLSQIHTEMNAGFRSEHREELLWEVQRIITQLKRKIKIVQKVVVENKEPKKEIVNNSNDNNDANSCQIEQMKQVEATALNSEYVDVVDNAAPEIENNISDKHEASESCELDEEIRLLKAKVNGLIKLKDKLLHNIEEEKNEITNIKKQLINEPNNINIPNLSETNLCALDEVMHLLYEENQVLQIKKLNLVRQIMEQQEICNDLRAKLDISTVT